MPDSLGPNGDTRGNQHSGPTFASHLTGSRGQQWATIFAWERAARLSMAPSKSHYIYAAPFIAIRALSTTAHRGQVESAPAYCVQKNKIGSSAKLPSCQRRLLLWHRPRYPSNQGHVPQSMQSGPYTRCEWTRRRVWQGSFRLSVTRRRIQRPPACINVELATDKRAHRCGRQDWAEARVLYIGATANNNEEASGMSVLTAGAANVSLIARQMSECYAANATPVAFRRKHPKVAVFAMPEQPQSSHVCKAYSI